MSGRAPLTLTTTWIRPRDRGLTLRQRRLCGAHAVTCTARASTESLATDLVPQPLDVVINDPAHPFPVAYLNAIEVDVDGRLVNPSRELVDGLDRMFGIDQDGLEELIAAWEAQHRVNAA